MVSFALVLKPSTMPLENCPLARNQFSKRGRCRLSIFATFFIGSIFERIVLDRKAAQQGKSAACA